MRVLLRDGTVTVTPGQPVVVTIEVTNTLSAIDGVSARVIGPEGVTCTSEPALLPLFPDTTGIVTMVVSFPTTLAAGPYQAEVQVFSAVQPDQPGSVPLEVVILPKVGVELTVVPPVRAGRHRATFTVMCDNTGNTVLDVALAASDPNRAIRSKFQPPLLLVGPGESAASQYSIKARRHFLGGEISHAIKILGSAPDLEVEAQARFRQSPVIPRGVRTILVLGLILAAWACAFLFGLNKAFSSDPLTKAVPPSFYAAAKVSPGGNALGLIAGVSSDAAPAGAVPKQGVVEGVGGTISGSVLAASTDQGIGRITIQAWRDSTTGPTVAASAATAADGTYSLIGLLPDDYRLEFSALGFNTLWYPATTSEAAATPVTVNAMGLTSAQTVTVTGMPGSITGTVNTGTATPVPVTVSVLPELGTNSPKPPKVTTNSSGQYFVPNLPTPGTYDLSFSANGYQPGSDVETLDGGDARIANTVVLTAAGAEIDGVVTNGTNPLGGVAITATANGQTTTSATPTTGAIGHFSLTNLASPATYVLTFTKAGFGTKTISVQLTPGQPDNSLTVALAAGTGTVSGLVSGLPYPCATCAVGPLPGVTVTVNGGSAPVTTQTLTAGGSTGDYLISGLATPGNYTLTFSGSGYTSETLSVALSAGGSESGANVTLPLSVGVISGTVYSNANNPPTLLGGVTVTVSNGNPADVRTTVTAPSESHTPEPANPEANFAIPALPAGGYSVTFSLSGYTSQTLFINVPAGMVAPQPVVTLQTASGG